MTYPTDDAHGDNWHLALGDSCERLAELADNTIGLSCYSPPFASLFTYSPSDRDLGNSATREEFLEHYGFIIREVLRVTQPGRVSAVHVQQLTTTKATHGVIGLTDFRGQVITAHQDAGWIFHGEITVDKCPQALRHGTPVLTPTGWVPIERISVGDAVIGSDGQATKIEGVWPQGVGEVFRVRFSDGTAVDCDGAHLWNVKGLGARRSHNWQTRSTADLVAGGVTSPSGRRRWEIPLVAPVEYAITPPLPLHPYIVGALLGDGAISQRASIGLASQRHVARRVGSLLPVGHVITEQPGTGKGDDTATFYISHPEWHRNDVLTTLRDLGMQGLRAWEKRIPSAYLTASIEDRKELLRGLLDTDGSIKANGAIWFGSTSQQLATDVADLVRSLGGIARIRCETVRRYEYKGETKNGRPAWLVGIAIDGDPLVTLPHKVSRWKATRKKWHREIVSIEPVGSDERTCITVGADDGLFVTDAFVVTHNSQAIRTKAHSLMFATLERDSANNRPALADYVLLFRKPGENATPVKPQVTRDEWIEWARPIWKETGDSIEDTAGCHAPWYGIRETDTLNEAVAKEDADERHLCPLQLPLIERCVRLWSNEGETVLSPFAGIGSEGVVSLRWGRRFEGCELKGSYWATACVNLRRTETDMTSRLPFDLATVATYDATIEGAA